MVRWVSGLTLTVAAVLVSGCGPRSDLPEVAPVKGKVTLDGKPMVLARIYFSPEGGGQSSEAVTNASGEYELVYKRDIMGAKIGKHTVRITTYEAPEVTDDGKVVGGKPELVPSQYNANSTLQKEVVAGENVFDFPLTSH